MGFRYRRSIRIARGVRVNVSKSGTSLSLGGRGVTTNIGPRGTRTTFSLPGTGLSYQTSRRSSGGGSALGGLLMLVLVGCGVLLGGHRSSTGPNGSSTQTSAQGAPVVGQGASILPTSAQPADAVVVAPQAAVQVPEPPIQATGTPSASGQSLDDVRVGAPDALALAIDRLRVNDSPAPALAQPSIVDPTATSKAHAPWRHVTAAGVHWNLRHVEPGGLVMQVEMIGQDYADVGLDPAFEALPLEAMNMRVDYIRRAAIQSFSLQTMSLTYARDGSLARTK